MASGGLRLLVKSNRAATTASVALGAAAPVALSLRPLMPSIDRMSATALAAPATWHIAEAPDGDVNPWDACHALVRDGLGVAGGAVAMAEPDLEQKWVWASPNRQAFGLTGNCDAAPSNSDVYAIGNTEYWFADEDHSQLDMARDGVGAPAGSRVRIAHLDTGYDPNHATKPKFLRTDLARNFVDADRPMDATDMPTALINPMFGHGTGTLGILAGNMIDNHLLGGAANLEIVPVRVANWVVLFRNSAIAQAFDYVHSLWDDDGKRVHVVTMSMGGIASAAWADAVNALYERGIFVVTAAGNNFGNLPTRYIVYPARFNRVIAACGVMADGRPYADLPIRKMAGCYGPSSKDATAMAGYTPNVPWAKFGCRDTVDRDGGGTSAATPQIAAAAALWLQKHKAAVDAYPEGWMRVEAVRKALVGTLRPPDARETGRVGKGLLRAGAALDQAPPPAAALARTAADFGVVQPAAPAHRARHGGCAFPGSADARAGSVADQPAVARPGKRAGGFRSDETRRRTVARGRANHRGPALPPDRVGGTQGRAGHRQRPADGCPAAGRRARPRGSHIRPDGTCARAGNPDTGRAASLGLCPRPAVEHRHDGLRPQRGRAGGAVGKGPDAGAGGRVPRGDRRRSGEWPAPTRRSTSTTRVCWRRTACSRRRATRSSTSRWSTPSR